MSLLLALAGAVVEPPQPPAIPEIITGGGYVSQGLKAKREPWRDELERLFAKPKAEVQKQAPKAAPKKRAAVGLTAKQQAYFDSLYAALIEAQNAQERARKMAAIAQAEGEAQAAIELLQAALAAENTVRQQMRDFDIVFVAAVLATM